jgi:hypothetical protein
MAACRYTQEWCGEDPRVVFLRPTVWLCPVPQAGIIGGTGPELSGGSAAFVGGEE